MPLAADDSVSHAALLAAVHVQFDAVVRLVLPLAPPAGTVADVVASAYVHPDAWLTLNATPPTVIVPLRAGPVLLAQEYASVPVPEAPAPIDSHDALLAAFHAQPLCVVTPIDPAPDDGETLADPGASDHVQLLVPPTFDARKFATVSAFWLCTRVVSAVDVEPSGSGGLPYVMFGFDR